MKMLKNGFAFFLFFIMGGVQAMELPGMVEVTPEGRDNSPHWLRGLILAPPPSASSSYTSLPSSASSRSLIVQQPVPEPRSNGDLKKLLLEGKIGDVSSEERERGESIFKQENRELKRKIWGNKVARFGSLLGACAGLVCIVCNEVDDQSTLDAAGLYVTTFCLGTIALGSSVLSASYMKKWREKQDENKGILEQLQSVVIKRCDETR